MSSIERVGRQHHWLPLIALLLIALLARLPSISGIAHHGDLVHFTQWMHIIDQHGVWDFYNPAYRTDSQDRTYPPLSTLTFDALRQLNGFVPDPRFALDNPNFVALLKIFPMVSELAVIAAVYFWLRDRGRLRWLIPGALALAPGLIATTSWWGQYDAPFTLFVLLALIALNRDRPMWAWFLFGIAALIKQPAVVLAPILLVTSLRRYGWRQTARGLVGCAVVYGLVSLPFALNNGVEAALIPYLRASDAFPYLSNNAYNFWHALASIDKGGVLLFREPSYTDSLPWMAGLSYKSAGLLMFGTFTLLIMAVCWRQAYEKREFVWAASLYFGFFMLPTQVHERYLYPAVVLLLIAIAQDRRVLPLALAAVVTYSYNLYAVTLPNLRVVPLLTPEILALPVVVMNALLFSLLVRWTVFDTQRRKAAQVISTAAVVSPHTI